MVYSPHFSSMKLTRTDAGKNESKHHVDDQGQCSETSQLRYIAQSLFTMRVKEIAKLSISLGKEQLSFFFNQFSRVFDSQANHFSR